MQAITAELLRDMFARAETVEEQEARAGREAEAKALREIDARLERSALSNPVWMGAQPSFWSRTVFALGLAAFGLTFATGAALFLEKSARNTAETIRQYDEGRMKW